MKEHLKFWYEVFCVAVLALAMGAATWWWGYWVGKNDTLALQALTAKEAKK